MTVEPLSDAERARRARLRKQWYDKGYAKQDAPKYDYTGKLDADQKLCLKAWNDGLHRRYADEDAETRTPVSVLRIAPASLPAVGEGQVEEESGATVRSPSGRRSAACPMDTPRGTKCKLCGKVH